MNFYNCNQIKELDINFLPGTHIFSARTRMYQNIFNDVPTTVAHVDYADMPAVRPGYWLACEVIKFDFSDRKEHWAKGRSERPETMYDCTP